MENYSMVQKDTGELQSFNEKQFITDLYELEKTKYTLEKRILNINNTEAAEAKRIKPISIPKFENTDYYQQYTNNIKTFIPLQNHILKESKLSKFKKKKKKQIKESLIRKYLVLVFSPFIVLFYMTGIPAIVWVINKIYEKLETKRLNKQIDLKNLDVEKKNTVIKEENDQLYRNSYSAYTRYVDQIKSDYTEYLAKRKLEIELFNESLDNEKQMAQAELERTESVLNDLYNLRRNDVLCIHPDYRGLYSISIIYGYFEKGRCFCLTGHEGAYNLYEEEKRQGIIMNKLNNLEQGMKNLNATTYYVSKTLESCNELLKQLNVSMYNTMEFMADTRSEDREYQNNMEQIGNSIAEDNAKYYERATYWVEEARYRYNLNY